MSAPFRFPPLLLWLLAGHSVLHVALGFALGLTADEAHYALYGAHLALSYYDHPPLVGWVQAPLVALHAPAGVLRLIPAALWAGTALLVYAATYRLHRLLMAGDADSAEAAGLWAVGAYSLAPLLHLLGIGLVPDTLLMFFTAAILWQTLRLLSVDDLRQWLLLGLLLGLAGLSKYTAIFAALPAAATLLAVYRARLLRRPGPWLALALALLLVLPVFVWNAQHDWISFRYQLQHGKGGAWRVGSVLVFALLQALLYPLLIRGALALRGRVRWDARCLGLLGFYLLPFAVLAYLSGGGSSLPHWTAPAWVALAPFAGLGLAALWAAGRRAGIRVLGAWQAVLTLALYALMLLGGAPWQRGAEPGSAAPEAFNPFTDFYGWDAAGARAAELARAHGVGHLAVQNWTLASRLAWYARPLPVHVLAPGVDQFSFWSGPLPPGASAVLLDWSQLPHVPPLAPGQFARCEAPEVLPVVRAGRVLAHFTLQVCHGWGGQPAPRRRGDG